jgi:hypothetical protein
MEIFKYEFKDYQFKIIVDADIIRFYLQYHQTGEIIYKDYNIESFIKNIFIKNIKERFDIKDFFD